MSNDEIARLQRAFEQDECLKSYIELRRLHPEYKMEVPSLTRSEILVSMSGFLLEHGIDPALVAFTMTGSTKHIEELSLELLERIHRQQDLRKQGQTHIKSRNAGLSDALIN